MKKKEARGAILAAALVMAAVFAGLFLGGRARLRVGQKSLVPSPVTSAEAAEIPSWTRAVQRVTEDRGEPVGKQAKVTVPDELRHYKDTRRFLAIQVAEWRKHHFDTPQDYADLAGLISRGEMVEVKPVSSSYILYGVGGRATGEPFTVYDTAARKSIPLLDRAEVSAEYERIAQSQSTLKDEISGLRAELSSLSKKERARRAELQKKVAAKEKSLKDALAEKESLDSFYGSSQGEERLFERREKLEALAKDFEGREYNLSNAASRKQMKVRMLSHLRPEALKVLEEVADSYSRKFNRPLPISSLVRPHEYQMELSKVNPNAIRMQTPPHSTGLAFDIFNKYMTAEEQQYVMDELARLEDAGRIEVLRENRDHFHVFAFIDGTRPDEALIKQSLGKAGEAE
ncbi:MAG TPA: DUF5715 family protein [Pyrinomonadaceae bacterium]|nr:DUF5715 family protein [Pyrinomonadaceae bacterium]